MRAWGIVGLVALTGCVDEAGPEGPRSVTTDEGLYALVVEVHPDPPQAGDVDLTVEIRSDGAAVEGATLLIEPWMPSMGHGITEPPTIQEAGGGRYDATFVINMPGTWELRLSVDGPAGPDETVLVYEVQ